MGVNAQTTTSCREAPDGTTTSCGRGVATGVPWVRPDRAALGQGDGVGMLERVGDGLECLVLIVQTLVELIAREELPVRKSSDVDLGDSW